MERKFLEELGLEKGTIDKILDENSSDIGKHKKAAETAVTERDSLKGQLDTVQAALKKFDGIDIDNLKGEIETLKTNLTTKETEFKSQLAERDFTAMLNTEILSAKGKNPKAVMALLDMEALKSSKNQKEDAAAAIKALSESDSYLFGDARETTTTKINTGGKHNEPGSVTTQNTTLAGAIAEHYKEKGE